MDIKKDEIILPEDPRSATYRTDISGWVSSTGHFFGKEEGLARYDGSTHKKCAVCATIIPKNSYCQVCARNRAVERYEAMPRKKWAGEPLYSLLLDEYFSDLDDANEHADFEDIPLENLMLIICVPEYGRTIPEDFFDLPDEVDDLHDVAPKLAALIDAVNAHIDSEAECLAWIPGDFAVELGG